MFPADCEICIDQRILFKWMQYRYGYQTLRNFEINILVLASRRLRFPDRIFFGKQLKCPVCVEIKLLCCAY
jgi:hypothetical protein